MLMASRQKHREEKLSLNIRLLFTPVEQVSEHRSLGVAVDEELKWQTHINSVCRTVSRNTVLLLKLNQVTSHKAKLALFFAHTMSHVHYV